jgi:hypothetical protein
VLISCTEEKTFPHGASGYKDPEIIKRTAAKSRTTVIKRAEEDNEEETRSQSIKDRQVL